MLYYSTNKNIPTTYKKVQEIVRKGRRDLPKMLEEEREIIFALYYRAESEYFKRYPNSADTWYWQLEKEYKESIPSVIATYVARYFDGLNENKPNKPEAYTLACRELNEIYS